MQKWRKAHIMEREESLREMWFYVPRQTPTSLPSRAIHTALQAVG